MICSGCGSPIQEGVKFCQACGKAVPMPAPSYNNQYGSYGGAGFVGYRTVSGPGFLEAYKLMWKNAVNFRGRARRSEYWFVQLLNCIVSAILTIIMFVSGGATIFSVVNSGYYSSGFSTGSTVGMVIYALAGIFSFLWSLVHILPMLSLQVRRLHDSNKSGKLILLPAICGIVYFGAVLVSILISTNSSSYDMPAIAVLLIILGVIMAFAAFISGVVLFVFTFFDSTRGPNKYGESNKYVSGQNPMWGRPTPAPAPSPVSAPVAAVDTSVVSPNYNRPAPAPAPQQAPVSDNDKTVGLFESHIRDREVSNIPPVPVNDAPPVRDLTGEETVGVFDAAMQSAQMSQFEQPQPQETPAPQPQVNNITPDEPVNRNSFEYFQKHRNEE